MNDWEKDIKHVIEIMNGLKEDIKLSNTHRREDMDKIYTIVNNIRVDVGQLQVKSGLAGVIGGLLASIVYIIIKGL